MKSPFIKTVVMALIAVVASGVAASYYPWPEPVVESEIIGKPLFESYDTTAVRSIRITKFNPDRNALDRMKLRRSGEKWIIPDHKNFIATNAQQISAAASSLSEALVLDEKTDEQQAYLEYGLVDPDEYQNTPNRSALGRKIILEDRNGKSLASLIVGAMLKDDPNRLKHFVRIPGQPSVYVIDFNAQALSTDFRSWVDPNLFALNSQMPVEQIVIENYKLDPKIGVGSIELNYRASLNVGQQGVNLLSVESGGEDGAWTKAEASPELNQQVQSVYAQISNIQYTDVRRQNDELAKLLKTPTEKANDVFLDALKPLGFFKKGFENSNYVFDSAGGSVSVATKDGLIITLYIGTIAEKSNAEDLQLSYNVIACAGVDESILPQPEKPEPNDDSEIADKEEKAYLRLVEQRKSAIRAAQVRAAEYNQPNAAWIYIVSESVIDNIRPELNVVAASPAASSESK